MELNFYNGVNRSAGTYGLLGDGIELMQLNSYNGV